VPWRLVVRRLHDQAPARALKPDIAVISPAIQIAAPPVLCNKGRQGVEDLGMGRGDYHSVDASASLRKAAEVRACERTAW